MNAVRVLRLVGGFGLAALLLLGACSSPVRSFPDDPSRPDEVDAAAAPRESLQDTARLLMQTSFGPTPESLERVRRQGFERYLDEQLRLRTSRMPVLPVVKSDGTAVCEPGAAGHICRRDHFSMFWLQKQFFQNALTEPDQLRQRVAWAWSQLLVVSGRKTNQAYGAARYQQMLLDHAFDNFRSLLTEVCLSPAMGHYLDGANNARGDPKRGTQPNENFARELLQLFSIGPVLLRPDGRPQLDAQGQALPSYGQAEVSALARALTGWTYPPTEGRAPTRFNPAGFNGALSAAPEIHDGSPKTGLRGQALAGDADPRRELDAVLDQIFAHPNVGPFIARRLIQQLTTADPSPAYVQRVAQRFDDNGRGVRGDIAAVVRAALLDREARGDQPSSPGFGRLREPVLLMTGLMRALGGRSDGVELLNQALPLEQAPFFAHSVFNFYPPDHVLTETGMNAPEFAISDSNTMLRRGSFVFRMVYGKPAVPDPTVPGATGTELSLDTWKPLAAQPAQLVEGLNAALVQGRLPLTAQQAVLAAVQSLPPQADADRVRMAAFLIGSSPEFQIQR